MNSYHIVSRDNTSTVVAEYAAEYRAAADYQSEAQLERDFIERLSAQGYERIRVASEAELVDNLRRQLEALNEYTFSEREWEQFFAAAIANKNEGIVERRAKSRMTMCKSSSGMTAQPKTSI